MRRYAWLMGLLLALAMTAPTAAGTGLTYNGRITGGEFLCSGAVVYPYGTVDGKWTLGVSGRTAVVTINVFYDGKHHLSFGLNGGVVEEATATTATVTFGDATATIADGGFSWHVPVPPCTDAHPYDDLTYLGDVSH